MSVDYLDLTKANFRKYGISINQDTENFLIVTQGTFLDNNTILH